MNTSANTRRRAAKTVATATAIAISLALSCSTAMAGVAESSREAVKCVQKELNALGFEAGHADGIVGVKTFLASEAYIRFMRANAERAWAQPSLRADNARHWCEKVAEAHPKVSSHWRALQKAEIPTDPKAIFDLAYRFDVGVGGKKDEALAVRWYLRAAELGYAPAQRNLGGMYGSGRGVPRNDVTARHWFLAAANQGDAQAQFVLGKHYSKDDQTSLGWLWKAAQQGHQGAILELEVRLDI
jgi:TPR repeat protein